MLILAANVTPVRLAMSRVVRHNERFGTVVVAARASSRAAGNGDVSLSLEVVVARRCSAEARDAVLEYFLKVSLSSLDPDELDLSHSNLIYTKRRDQGI